MGGVEGMKSQDFKGCPPRHYSCLEENSNKHLGNNPIVLVLIGILERINSRHNHSLSMESSPTISHTL